MTPVVLVWDEMLQSEPGCSRKNGRGLEETERKLT